MVVDCVENKCNNSMFDDVKDDARMNVLYSPFRKREVNPQDWESKMSFWKSNISKWCTNSNTCVFSLVKLQSAFARNGRHPTCLTTVLDDMLRKNEIVNLQDFLSRDANLQTWSSWAVNCFVKAPIIWSFTKLKESLISNAKFNSDEEFIHLDILREQSKHLKESCLERFGNPVIDLEELKSAVNAKDEINIRVILHWLQLQGQAAVTVVNGKSIVKLSSSSDNVKPFTEADIGLYQLQLNEQALMHMLEQLESEKQQVDQEARNYLKKGMRQVAKTCLRKKKELDKCIEKRAAALENVQMLLSRVKEAQSDGEILESYKMGLLALKTTFKEAGLSEKSVDHTMDQVQEVLEAHEEIQNRLSEPVNDSLDEDLEKELLELLNNTQEFKQQSELNTPSTLKDLPEPPTHSPVAFSRDTPMRDTQQLAQ